MDPWRIVETLYRYVWGPEVMVLFLLVGAYLTVVTGFIQFRRLGVVVSEALGSLRERTLGLGGMITPFQATMIALGGTLGQGNLVGVAAALAVGGPGAVFWMWVAGLLGMATKFAEATLAVHYRRRFDDGTVSGGPMYYLSRGLPSGLSWLGGLYALLAALAAFGVGNLTQSSALASGLRASLGVPVGLTGLATALTVAFLLAGGIKRVAWFAQLVVPFMVVTFLVAGTTELALHVERLGSALAQIVSGAFGTQAAAGGALGLALKEVVKAGVGRGVFSNESGLGVAAIAHAQAQVDHPVRQGFWGVIEVLLDTLVVNTLMALILITSGSWERLKSPTELYVAGWQMPGAGVVAGFVLALFVFTTIVSWGFYGEEAACFLLGEGIRWPYRITYVVTAFVGALGGFDLFITIADTLNGLMALPNLVGLVVLGPLVGRLVAGFFRGELWVPPRGR